ncbi:glutamate 5-kinase [Candidatus Peregrinibacteria bacterium CG11_big_fil_rev_8_21_14_0_20_46_8]|nr:MAG: glutamate 5-kinase [Candidatus Peregrinibacteria bacterium CG11_big_fil_rev_8_21_14_0_20_46_8]
MIAQPAYKKIVIKIGTNVITRDNGLLDTDVMAHLVEQIGTIKKSGADVIMVSSGAIGAGRPLLKPKKAAAVIHQQLLAAVGQIPLMDTYTKLFRSHDLTVAQVLAVKEDFRDRTHYLNMQNCFEALLHNAVIPIVNENDVIAISELMFTDNDELAGLIAAMMNVDALIILSNIDGVFDGDPHDSASRVIPEIDAKRTDFESIISPRKSSFGRGGMLTKSRIARKLSTLGIVTHIANGKDQNTLRDIFAGKPVGTRFVTNKHASGMKRWIAHAEGNEKGSVLVNTCAAELLRSQEKIMSLLPVGCIKIEGEFAKGDVIKICDEKGTQIGIGMAQYDSGRAREYLGQKGKKELVHYDYLFIK